VLPDGSLTGDGVKQRIRQKLLEVCNVHTIVRLPQSVFAPYATVNTNLIFFDKAASTDSKPATKEIWYYEHTLPEGAKAYSKTKPIRIEEFEPIKAWWHKREENEVAWKVPLQTIIDRNYDLDIKNPNKKVEEVVYDRKAIIQELEQNQLRISQILDELKSLA
jgi:type I restriction enzyme M protein